MVSKTKQAMGATEEKYRHYLVQIGYKPGDILSKKQKEEAHAAVVPEILKIDPEVNTITVKKRLGFVMTSFNAGPQSVGEKKPEVPLDPKPEDLGSKPSASTVGAEKLGELEKRVAGMEGTVNSVAGAIQGLTEFLAKQTVTGNGRSEQVKQIEARFPMFEVKLMLDTFRMSLFQAWKADHRFEGEIEDFLKDAFDEALRMRGANLEYTAHKGSVIR